MGIINITPDSFYKGFAGNNTESILNEVEKMVTGGVDIIDIGGQSTKPGSNSITAAEELQRIIPVIEKVHKEYPELLISVDTFYAEVAAAAVAAGAAIVNDVSAGLIDAGMLATVARLKVPYICMHMKGRPDTMQQNMHYDNIITELLDFFNERIAVCTQNGINDIIIDPGFGFGKSIAANIYLLKHLSLFRICGKPLLTGLSRKSTVYKTLHIDVEDALNGTTVLNTIALLNGADIIRVHDVKEAREVAELTEVYRSTTSY